MPSSLRHYFKLGEYRNTNVSSWHRSRVTTPRKGDQTPSIFMHTPKVLMFSDTLTKKSSFVLKSKLMLRRKSNTCVACTEVSKHQLSCFPKHSGFLISDSLHVPSVLHLQGHRRTDCCRAGEAIIPHRT